MTEAQSPLVPSECDLRGLPWMPVDTVRLLDSDLFALSTGEEFKAAVALWCKAWQQVPAASLPSDDRVLAHLSGAGARWKKVKEQALRGFVLCTDGRLYHPVIAEKALEAWSHRIKQRERAGKRWHPNGNATADATASPTAHATAMQGTGTGQDKKPKAEDRSAFAPPDWIDADAWKGFEEMRRKVKAAMTDRARNGIVAELARLKAEGQDPNAVLDQSTRNGWKDVYALKVKTGQQPAATAKPWFLSKSGIEEKARELSIEIPVEGNAWQAMKTRILAAQGVTDDMVRKAAAEARS